MSSSLDLSQSHFWFISENLTAKQAWLWLLQNGFNTFLDTAAVVAAVGRVFVSLDKQT